MLNLVDDDFLAQYAQLVADFERVRAKVDGFNGPGIHNESGSMSFHPIVDDAPSSPQEPASSLPRGQYVGDVFQVVSQNGNGGFDLPIVIHART